MIKLKRMNQRKRRYSVLIKPIFLLVDLTVLNFLLFLLNIKSSNSLLFPAYISICWIIISLATRFYETKRFSNVIHTLSSLIRQFIILILVLYAFIGLFKQSNLSRIDLAKYFFASFILISFAKYLLLFLLNKYRKILGGNFRNVVVIGDNKKTNQLIDTFDNRSDFGYKFQKKFCVRKEEFSLENCFEYIIDHEIDEIYCSVAELTNTQLREIVSFTDNNLKVLKFIPDNKDIFTKKLSFDYYGYTPVLSFRDIPLDDTINIFVKRGFDVLLSLIVLIFILSWLTPLLFLLIQIESKGPVFFMQKRNGLDYGEFFCYKYRSMKPSISGEQTTKGDARVTKIGKFIRKTSIDELPQFINVLKGDMSVVGPRPHMVKHNEDFAQKVDKFMVRHFVKPGISGLAQVSGFRGEIETDKDIVNRVKYDIFYVENWSLLLDIKIIFLTVLNAFKGEEKAY